MRNLKLLRNERGLTQRELAHKAGVSQVIISYWERSIVKPSPDMVLRLSRALDVDPGILTGCEAKVVFDDTTK